MKRVKLKKKIHLKKVKPLNFIIFVALAITIGVTFCLYYLNTKIAPKIFSYASLEVKRISSIIINKAIATHVTEKVSADELFTITTDDNGEIKSIDFNTAIINKFLTDTTNSIQVNLRNIERGNIEEIEFIDSLGDYNPEDLKKGVVYQISSGIIFGNTLLANIGPKIPVKLSLVGDATSNVSTEVTNYGINNALIQVYVNLKISEQIMIPFFSDTIDIEVKVPVTMKLVTGTVPDYYVDGYSESTPSIVIPSK